MTLAILLLSIYPKETKIYICSQKDLFKNVDKNFIRNL